MSFIPLFITRRLFPCRFVRFIFFFRYAINVVSVHWMFLSIDFYSVVRACSHIGRGFLISFLFSFVILTNISFSFHRESVNKKYVRNKKKRQLIGHCLLSPSFSITSPYKLGNLNKILIFSCVKIVAKNVLAGLYRCYLLILPRANDLANGLDRFDFIKCINST